MAVYDDDNDHNNDNAYVKFSVGDNDTANQDYDDHDYDTRSTATVQYNTIQCNIYIAQKSAIF